MQKTKVNNPPFPHQCRIYRMAGETAWEDGHEEVLYDGECMVQPASSKRTFTKDGVIKTDYSLYIPGLVREAGTGCFIDYTDYVGKYERIPISHTAPGHMGTSVYFNMSKN